MSLAAAKSAIRAHTSPVKTALGAATGEFTTYLTTKHLYLFENARTSLQKPFAGICQFHFAGSAVDQSYVEVRLQFGNDPSY